MNKYSLSEKLIMLRKSRGLTQPDMALLCRTTQATVSRWENGDFIPGIDSLKEIAEKTGIDFNMLLDSFSGELKFPPKEKPITEFSRFR